MRRTHSSAWHLHSTYSLNVIPEEIIPKPDYDDDDAYSDGIYDTADAECGRKAWRAASPSNGRYLQASAHNLMTSSVPAFQEGPGVAIYDDCQTAPQKIANFLSRPFRSGNPLKRTKSVSKLEQRRRDDREAEFTIASRGHNDAQRSQENICAPPVALQRTNMYFNPQQEQSTLRSSRSHESLLGSSTHMIDLSDPETRLHPVHPSVLDVPNCFRVANTYYACRSPLERAKWMENLRRTMNPRRDSQRRIENGLQVWILEAKGIPTKRRYYCELCLDKTLYARTSAKPKQDICFWGQHFEFSMIPNVDEICINLYREADVKKKKDRCTLIGFVPIKTEDLAARHPIERWYTVTSSTDANKISLGKNNSQEQASIRIKARWQQVEILPLHCYDDLLNFVMYNYLPLCLQLEPVLGVKTKEDLATSMVRILHRKRMAKDFLCDLIMSEVAALDNEHLMFRGNSLATKSMEAFMKLVADEYLKKTLSDFVRELLNAEDDCEVDPLKLGNASNSQLERHRNNLKHHVEMAWGKIINSTLSFPLELREVFESLRRRLDEVGRRDLADNLISSSIFLRFLCPAILSPSLFDLVPEYPSARASRNLTLIAKTLQNLANFTKFGGKESYMEFMNEFVVREWEHMHEFLLKISRRTGERVGNEAVVDEGKELSLLATYLDEVWTEKVHDKAVLAERRVGDLRPILDDLSECKRRSTSINTHSLSDYDNAAVLKTRNHNLPIYSPPAPGQAVVTRAQPAPNLNTSDDYVLSTAFMDESLAMRQAGTQVQHARKQARPRPSLSARLQVSDPEATLSSRTSTNTASSSTSDPHVDTDSESEYPGIQRSRKTKRRGMPEVIAACEPGCSQAPPSSGYQSHNHSSYSTSSSSSPVERTTGVALAITNPAFGAPPVRTPSHPHIGFRRSSPNVYQEENNYRLQPTRFEQVYATPADSMEPSGGNISPANQNKTSLPRTNPRAWYGQSTPRTNPMVSPQPKVEQSPQLLNNNNDKWSNGRSVMDESKQWPATTFEQQLHQQKIIDEQKRKIEQLIRENELLKRQMQIQVVADKTAQDTVNAQHFVDSGASEDSYDSLNSLERHTAAMSLQK